MTVGSSIRPGSGSDVGWVAALLADAFSDYAWTRWIVSAEEHALRLRALYRLYVAEVALPHGELWVDDARAGAAAWLRSDAPGIAEAQERIGPDVAELAGDRLHQAVAAEDALAAVRATEPHWFLSVVGVTAAERGRGLGTRLLAPRLQACDAAGEGAALETSAERTVGFYERLGFEVRDRVQLPDGGPDVWLMWREPAGGGQDEPSLAVRTR